MAWTYDCIYEKRKGIEIVEVLIAPEIWVEYHRLIIKRNNCDFVFRSQVALIDKLIPGNIKTRTRFSEDHKERVWEYLM